MRARIGILLALGLAAADAQRFEAATVKIAAGGQRGGRASVNGDRVTFSNTTVLNALAQAYGLVSRDQVEGPSWVFTERYDIVAKAPDNTPKDQIRLMLRNLLTERFKLVLHHETRDLPAYALVIGRGRLRLKEVQAPPVKDDWAVDGERRQAKGMSMASLVEFLTLMVQAPVVDTTGLKGYYDFPLEPTREETRREEAPSIFDVLDDLGLRLDSRKLPLDVVVVESRSKTPVEN